MRIVEFLNLHGIRWFPIRFRNGKPKVILAEDNLELPDPIKESLKTRFDCWASFSRDHFDFEGIPDEDVIEAQSLVGSFNHIAIDTREVFQVDVDADGKTYLVPLLEICPWFESVSKKLPHILFRSSTRLKRSSCDYQQDRDVELLCGRLSFAKKDTEVFNWTGGLPEFDGVRLVRNELMGRLGNHIVPSRG